jgi:hypothetical protein
MSQSGNHRYKAPTSKFVPIVIGGKLAFRFDPVRGLIEWQHRGEKHVIDLADYAGEGDGVSAVSDQTGN